MRAGRWLRRITRQSQRECGYIVELTGTLSLDVRRGTDTGFRGEIVDSYRET
jgi:hypothetical protein